MSPHEHTPPHVLAPDRLSACEGCCGVTLMPAAAEHAPYEIAYVLELPSAVELIAEHTPARCRAIRALREAGERAAGEGGSAFVLDEHSSFRVRAWDGASRWAECPIGREWVLGTGPAELAITAAEVERLLRGALADPSSVAHRSPTAAPIIARDPYLGRTS